ncbi:MULTISPECIES: DUF1080 domain-containing protein [Arcicella]|uniref:DUF1080 domain-containing protein n=1 Tax=Arcicella aquatica TaxID=217141 RepID=A0ABU5QSS2_9BACT|nr:MULTISPECIES: DUF1080 domain-containing protein [Arcicella]MDR6561131.1 hypothetical protein [Arcicella sp. BE51]MDR6811015.1 hypothetical protein [Arcicella sp. BE140]MDR6822365.1 hypothetical protein [Arcicella sp. BE139]MEA5260141.1 DUF1080 domain-containing protein [Arcicella aquatica]
MKKYLILICLLNGCLFSMLAQKKADKQEWIKLFNGKNLDGWDIKIAGEDLNVNYKNTFRVEDGMMRVAYDQYKTFDDKFGHIYYKTPYSYYIIRFEYRFQGEQLAGGASWNVRNSGVMLHSQSAKSLSKGQSFPVSLELQLLGGLGKGERHTGNLCTPGTEVYMNGKIVTDHCTDSNSKTYNGDQWVKAEAIVFGDSLIHHIIEGDTVLTFEKLHIGGGFVSPEYDWKQAKIDNGAEWIKKDGQPLKEGYIAMQAESHAIDFRNIELLNLKGCTDPKAINYKSYYKKSDNKSCVYRK